MKKTLAMMGNFISRKEQKNVLGGLLDASGTGIGCCATIPSSVLYAPDGSITSVTYRRDCGFSRANAISVADSAAVQTGAQTWWCCASC